MKVVFSQRASNRVRTIDRWWKTHRRDAPDLFRTELDEAVRKLTEEPGLAVVHEVVRGKPFRRLLLKRTEQHLYYLVDDEAQTVHVHAIWGARRRRLKL